MYRFTRSALPLALLSLLSSANASPARAECLLARSDELAALSSCGITSLLSSCLASVPEDASLTVVQQCFSEAGCSAEDAAIEAGSALKQCEQGVKGAELRFREMESMPYITDAPKLGLRAEQTFVPSIQCSTDTTISVSMCTPVVNGDATSQSCFPTTQPTKVCDAANVCMKDSQGLDICMVRQDKPTTSGLVVTIALAVVFVTGIATMIFLCCRDSREAKRIKAQHEAAQIAKGQKQPLLDPAEEAAPPPAAHGQDPFVDQNRH